MFTLYAEREGHRVLQNTDLATMDEAEIVVETSEAHGLWPEGYNAVLYRGYDPASAECWVYVDGWEKTE